MCSSTESRQRPETSARPTGATGRATGPYIVGVPAFEQIATGVHPATTMHRSTFFCYDGDNGTASSNCPGVPKKGLLTAVQQVDDKGYYVTTRYGYDAVGNHATTTNPRNNGTGRFFEPTYRVFPESVCNALFQCTKVEWDTTLGQITKLTDPNKATTEFEYDPLGRLELDLPQHHHGHPAVPGRRRPWPPADPGRGRRRHAGRPLDRDPPGRPRPGLPRGRRGRHTRRELGPRDRLQ